MVDHFVDFYMEFSTVILTCRLLLSMILESAPRYPRSSFLS